MQENYDGGSVSELGKTSGESDHNGGLTIEDCLKLARYEAFRVRALGIVPYTITFDDLVSEAHVAIADLYPRIGPAIFKKTLMRKAIRDRLLDTLKCGVTGGYRSAKRQLPLPEGGGEPHYSKIDLRWLLARLEQKHVQIIRLIYYEGLTLEEASKRLRLTVPGTQSRLVAAIGSCQKIFFSQP